MNDDWLDDDDEQWLEDEQLEGRADPWKTFADFLKHNPGSTDGDWERYRKTHWDEGDWDDFYNAYYEDQSMDEVWECMECVDFLYPSDNIEPT